MKGMATTFLTYKDEATNSDKYYDAKVIDLENGYYATYFRWGRRGSNGQEQVKVYPTSALAGTAFNKKVSDKERKGGYGVINSTATHMIDAHVANVVARFVDQEAGSNRMTTAPVFTATTVDLTDLVSMATQGVTLALGTPAQVAEATVIRSKLKEQMAELKQMVTEAEGRYELLSTVLEGALA